jgi:hypothetical protein
MTRTTQWFLIYCGIVPRCKDTIRLTGNRSFEHHWSSLVYDRFTITMITNAFSTFLHNRIFGNIVCCFSTYLGTYIKRILQDRFQQKKIQ